MKLKVLIISFSLILSTLLTACNNTNNEKIKEPIQEIPKSEIVDNTNEIQATISKEEDIVFNPKEEKSEELKELEANIVEEIEEIITTNPAIKKMEFVEITELPHVRFPLPKNIYYNSIRVEDFVKLPIYEKQNVLDNKNVMAITDNQFILKLSTETNAREITIEVAPNYNELKINYFDTREIEKLLNKDSKEDVFKVKQILIREDNKLIASTETLAAMYYFYPEEIQDAETLATLGYSKNLENKAMMIPGYLGIIIEDGYWAIIALHSSIEEDLEWMFDVINNIKLDRYNSGN